MLVELMLVGMAAMMVGISLAVEMIEVGSVVISPLIGAEVACVPISVTFSFTVSMIVPLDEAGVWASKPVAGVLAGTSVVIGEEVCCWMSVLTTDDTTVTSEVEEADISLGAPAGPMILDTAD